jgi:hypothetical protein
MVAKMSESALLGIFEFVFDVALEVVETDGNGFIVGGGAKTGMAGVVTGWPSRMTTGRLDRITVPIWLVKVIPLPEPCCWENPPI